jgi:hypothetical protein
MSTALRFCRSPGHIVLYAFVAFTARALYSRPFAPTERQNRHEISGLETYLFALIHISIVLATSQSGLLEIFSHRMANQKA